MDNLGIDLKIDKIDNIIATVLEDVCCELQDVSNYNVNACAFPYIPNEEYGSLKAKIREIVLG